MNQREKLQTQLELLQELKKQFAKQVLIPSGEHFASMDTRYESGEIQISMNFDQNKFEETIQNDVDVFFSDYVYEIEKDLDKAIEEEENASFLNSSPVNENTIDELMDSIKTQLVNSIKK